VLGAYIVVGLLDSVHFQKKLARTQDQTVVQYSPEIVSLLDLSIGKLRKNTEKTYSAPFALKSFVKETLDLSDGSMVRDYPALRISQENAGTGGESSDGGSAFRLVLIGIVLGVSIWIGITAVLILLLRMLRINLRISAKALLTGDLGMPWNVIFYTVGGIIVSVTVLGSLAGSYHVFGTDKVGQDVLYQTIKSIRTGLVIGCLTPLIMLPFALLLGIAAGYFGGWIDDVIQYLYTTLRSIPGVLLIASAILLLQVFMEANPEMFDTLTQRSDMRLLFLCMILGITSWTGLCRLLRGETLKVREIDYIKAAVSLGVGHFKIILQHIFPNVLHIVIIVITLDFSGLVLAEAVLSYVGVGVDPSMISWGNMINSARLEMARDPMVWWSLLSAFVFMFVLVLAANLFADAVRDAFDPKTVRK